MEEIESLVVASFVNELPINERRVYKELLQHISSPAVFWQQETIKKEFGITLPNLKNKLQASAKKRINQIQRWLREGIKISILSAADYPEKLAHIQDPPAILYYFGELPTSQNDSMAIVGSRQADLQVCQWAYEMGKVTAERGVCVVSGLAYGVDARAHQGALDSNENASTIAVLGGGLKRLYPVPHLPLAKRIIENGGAVISQFLPESSPLPCNFLNRNRIIAGLSDQVLVVQAGKKSGSLSTARSALEEGRDVLVCAGRYGDERFQGSNHLIKQGAYVISEIADLLSFLPEKNCQSFTEISQFSLSQVATEILELLQHGAMDIEELVEHFVGIPNIRREILELELHGKVVCMPGDMIARV